MASLPYAVPYEYDSFETPDGKAAGNYDELISQVYFQKYDAVVGDITILANRSLYVDFTLPYTDSGVSMIVPIIDNRSKSAWVFLKPLTWDVWVTSACFFVFVGFVIWTLEHRINKDFRGPCSHQVGTIFWFSFSTLVFAHSERIVSNLARFVVIISFFVVIILTQSYAASLASMLTVEQLKPTVSDINNLIRTGQCVGYQNGSFVYGFLKKMKLDESKLVTYDSPEQLDELFSNGSIAAAFDEVPYMKLFLTKYCSKYTAVLPMYKFDGFGFVFPKHSPLVFDVSKQILNVTEGDQMENYEQEWFGQKSSCPELSSSLSSNSLGLSSFWGLFLIAGVASSAALIICTVTFLYENRDALVQLDSPAASTWRKIKALATRFDNKDVSFHTFREGQMADRSGINGMDAVTASPASNCPPSPSCPSVQTQSNFAFLRDQATPASEYGDPISPDRQTSPETAFGVELAKSNQEWTGLPEVVSCE